MEAMMNLIYSIFMLTLTSQLLEVKGAASPALIEKCCNLGRNWFTESRESCNRYQATTILGVETEDQEICRNILDLCCVQEKTDKQCVKGKQIAKIRGTCSELQSQSGNEHAKECCNCCHLGRMIHDMGMSCDAPWVGETFGARCVGMFQECCNADDIDETEPEEPGLVEPTEQPRPQLPDDEPDICARFPGQLCGHICVPLPGSSFKCSCHIGFELLADQKTCRQQDKGNRCDLNNPCQHQCIDTGVAIHCDCFDGYLLQSDGRSCADVDECTENTHTCNTQQTCVNTRGSFTCEDTDDNPNDGNDGDVGGVNQPNSGTGCELGFAYNRIDHRCEDIDECIIGIDTCSREEECINTEGSYRCQRSNPGYVDCGEGYQYNPATYRCELDFRPNTGTTRVDCGTGFTYNQNTQRCEDINECALNRDTCLEGQTCENNVGSFKCRRTISCGTGYTVDTNTQSCVDDDECVLGTHNCGVARECRNVPGSFRCVNKECPQGYRLDYTTGQCTVVICPKGLKADAIGNCIDINECQERTNPCRANQECRNTIGSFSCRNKLTCRAGHKLNEAGTQCLDIDECADNALNDCRGLHQFCTNRPSTYLCQCEEGFRMDLASRQCEDINECDQYGGQVCALNARCENTEGSFMCICKEGFRSEENGRVCRDVDECETPGMCMHNCRNTWGSFQCTCYDGYQLADDKRSCEDIDECNLWSRGGGQLCIGHCQNTPGSYQCSCPTGYVMMNDGRTCQDVDECATKTANCDGADNICINTRGGFKCESVTCPKGFVKAPSLGNRNNNIRCQRQTFVCPQGDTECLYAPLSYSINYITFPSQIQVPAELFTMRGPLTPHRRLQFVLTMNAARDPRTGEKRVTQDFFKLNNVRSNEAVVQLLRRIEGPQDVELQLNMNIYSTEFSDNAEEIFFGTAVAKITLFVTGDEWNNARRRTHFLLRK